MNRLILIIGVSFLLLGNCLQDVENDNKYNDVIVSEFLNLKSDCIYCTDTQANGGTCSCYTSISVGACQGTAAGTGKSNSYLISCSDLTSSGTWVEQGGVFHCESHTCPPEAYRAAFTPDGL